MDFKLFSQIKNKYTAMPIQMKASIWFLCCSFIQKGISTISTPIFTRIMSVEEYGQFSVFLSWLGILTVFVSLNLSSGVYTQGLVKFEDDKKIFSSSLQGLTALLAVAWTLTYMLFAPFWNKVFSLSTTKMLMLILLIWVSSTFNFWATEQRISDKYKLLVTVSLIASLVQPIVGVIFVQLSTNKVDARIISMVLVELVCFGWCFIYQVVRGKKVVSRKYWGYALAFNIPLIPHYLSQTLLNSADRVMIERIVGAEEAGIYSLAYSISLLMTLFSNALLQTLNPWIYKQIKAERTKNISPIAYLSLIMIAVVNLLLIVIAPEIMSIFAPKEYADATWLIPPIAMSTYFMFSYSLFACFEFYFQKTRLIAITTFLSALLNIILNYVAINIFGYYAAAYTTLFCYIFYAVFHYLAMSKICRENKRIDNPYKPIFLVLISLSFVLVGFALMFTYELIIVRYLLLLFTAIICILKWKKLYLLIQSLR